MANNLVIVESPSKALTIKGYLGSNYKVVASIGHVRDLPKSSLGIDIENGFEPHYINIRGKGDVIKQLKKAYPQANVVAVDYDPGASEVNQLNRIKLMLSTAKKNLEG